jgi:ElaA protein
MALSNPTGEAPVELDWRLRRFDALTARELQSIWQARQMVFALEQGCVYLDIDGADEACWHLAAWSVNQAVPLAYARLVDAGVKFTEPSIGRVLTTATARGTGLGRELMRRAIAHAHSVYPGQAIRISAQSQLERFYGEFGFTVASERYMEDGIPHTEMLLAREV